MLILIKSFILDKFSKAEAAMLLDIFLQNVFMMSIQILLLYSVINILVGIKVIC